MSQAGQESAPRRRSGARGAVFVGELLVAAALLGGIVGCGGGEDATSRDAAGPGLESLPGAIYDPPRPAPALRLTDAEGTDFDLANQRGRVILVFFGFTECPDICPATFQRWARVRAALGPDTSRVRFVFVSIDPEKDSPAITAEYARKFDPSFVGLSGTVAEIGEVALAWGVSEDRAHTTQVFVVNPQGLIPWGYGRSASVEEIVRGIRTLARGPSTR
ncbi:MAG: SCO family protein [Candidatus Eisenbacteria bacterium]